MFLVLLKCTVLLSVKHCPSSLLRQFLGSVHAVNNCPVVLQAVHLVFFAFVIQVLGLQFHLFTTVQLCSLSVCPVQFLGF